MILYLFLHLKPALGSFESYDLSTRDEAVLTLCGQGELFAKIFH